MVDILFRGKRADNGEWIYGYYIKADVAPKDHIHKDVHCIIPYGKLTKTLISDNYIYEVDPKTVGQYTRVKDRNEKKIFDDDILIGTSGDRYGVLNIIGAFALIDRNFEIIYMPNDIRKYEVIGNVYDNPELLRGEENGH